MLARCPGASPRTTITSIRCPPVAHTQGRSFGARAIVALHVAGAIDDQPRTRLHCELGPVREREADGVVQRDAPLRYDQHAPAERRREGRELLTTADDACGPNPAVDDLAGLRNP